LLIRITRILIGKRFSVFKITMIDIHIAETTTIKQNRNNAKDLWQIFGKNDKIVDLGLQALRKISQTPNLSDMTF